MAKADDGVYVNNLAEIPATFRLNGRLAIKSI
jgi:hypothetical protein